MVKLEINFSNKFAYLVVGIFILIVGAGVVYAAAFSPPTSAVPNPGHSLDELQTCPEGETLVMKNGAWDCGSGGGSLSCVYRDIPDSTTKGNEVCISGETCLVITAADGTALSCDQNSNTNYKANCCKVA